MRLIDADELKKYAIHCEIQNGALTELCVPLYQINNAPTVEPKTKLVANVTFDKEQMEELVEKAKADILAQIERLNGEWNYIQAGMAICPFCGATPHKQYKNFCPKCGADMRGEKDDKQGSNRAFEVRTR